MQGNILHCIIWDQYIISSKIFKSARNGQRWWSRLELTSFLL